jgi:hypothetical protein
MTIRQRRALLFIVTKNVVAVDDGAETPEAILTEAGEELAAENDDVLIQE